METTPDISFFFAIHRHMRSDLHRYAAAVTTAVEADRPGRLKAMATWSKGFIHELEEHHYVEDTFFFPDMRVKVPSVAAVLDRLEADHRTLDGLLERWPSVATALADAEVPFARAQADAVELAEALRDLLLAHLDVEDNDVLPLYWRHYTAEEYDVVFQQAVKKGKKAGLGFVVPWNVECLEEAEQAPFVAAAPLPLRLIYRFARPRYERLIGEAFGAERFEASRG